jgi:hypothetical protein
MFEGVNGYFIPVREVEEPKPEDMGYLLTFYLVGCQHENSKATQLNNYGDGRVHCPDCELSYEYNTEIGGIYMVGG